MPKLNLRYTMQDVYWFIIVGQFLFMAVLLFCLLSDKGFKGDLKALNKSVKEREAIIQSLTEKVKYNLAYIDSLKAEKQTFERRIDELEKAKSQIQIVYRDKIVALKSFTYEDVHAFFVQKLKE